MSRGSRMENWSKELALFGMGGDLLGSLVKESIYPSHSGGGYGVGKTYA